jgi:hypothetical protein
VNESADDASDVLPDVICNSWFRWKNSKQQVEEAMAAGKPVKFARLSIPQAVHPRLLYAISVAPRPSVGSSVAAKAITSAAFGKVAQWYVVDFLVSLFKVTILSQMASSFRDTGHSVQLVKLMIPETICRCVLALLGTKDFIGELLVVKCYRANGWEYSGWWKFLLCFLDCLLVVVPSHVSEQWLRVLLSVAMTTAVLRGMTFLCAFETRRVGLHILPVVECLKESVSFLLVIAFALVASTCAFWGLSDRSVFSVFWSMYRLGLLADFDAEDDIFGGVAESVGWECIAFVLTSLFISVTLMNIFIGIMTGLYDHHQSRVVELFVKRRALTTLRYMLHVEEVKRFRKLTCPSRDRLRHSKTRQLWFCFKDEDDDGLFDNDDDLSLRSVLRRELKDVKSGIEKLEREVEGLKRDKSGISPLEGEAEELEGKIGGPSVEKSIELNHNSMKSGIERLERDIEGLKREKSIISPLEREAEELKGKTGGLSADVNITIKCVAEEARREPERGRVDLSASGLN